MNHDEYEYREAEKLREQRRQDRDERFGEYPPTQCAHGVALSSWCPQCDSETLDDQTDEEGWEDLDV